MGRLGQRKYQCGECQATQFIHWACFNRAARVRCTACGSAKLELVTTDAKKEQAHRQQAVVKGIRSASMQHPGGRKDSRRKIV